MTGFYRPLLHLAAPIAAIIDKYLYKRIFTAISATLQKTNAEIQRQKIAFKQCVIKYMHYAKVYEVYAIASCWFKKPDIDKYFKEERSSKPYTQRLRVYPVFLLNYNTNLTTKQ